jgi:hypothetical protein
MGDFMSALEQTTHGLARHYSGGPRLRVLARVSMASLVPIMWSTGVGSDVMKPIAAPIIGGMITSTIHVAQALHRIGKFYVFLREVRAEQVRAPQRLHKEESERRDTIMAAT